MAVPAEYGDESHWGVPEDSYLVLVCAPALVALVLIAVCLM